MMETQFQYIQQLAIRYSELIEDTDILFQELSDLPVESLQDIFNEYGDRDRRFKPVNLLRAELARRLLDGQTLDEQLIEAIKEHIRNKEFNQFSDYGSKVLEEWKNYAFGKRDVFANWQKHWHIFHTFFYRGKEKETVQQYLEQLGQQFLSDLNLQDYTFHTVDFYGPNNFGSDSCWIALYPISKDSHRDAYQFFFRISANPHAGRMAGHAVRAPLQDKIKPVHVYQEALDCLLSFKKEILSLNKKLRNYFKFAPGPQAVYWETFYQDGKAAINFSHMDLGDISDLKSLEEINLRAGFPKDSNSNHTWNLWLFKHAHEGDVVFATKGVNICLGIGIVEGSYYYEEAEENQYCHQRKIKWLTDKVFQYRSNTIKGNKNLFRPDTFSPTKVWQFLLNEYIRLYPDLVPIFEENHLPYELDMPSEKLPVSDIENDEFGKEEEKEVNYWWLNANPKIWSISAQREGDLQTYTSRNEKGNKRRVYKYFETVAPGDQLIGYESTPEKKVVALLEITKRLHHSDDEGEVIEFQILEKPEVPIPWNDLVHHPALQECEVFVNNQGSLFKLTEEEFDIIRDIMDTKNIQYERTIQQQKIQPYQFSVDPDKPFITEDRFEQMVNLLKRKKNIILQGPPGVGKTFIADKLAYSIIGKIIPNQLEIVQFHQSYSYEDFIQGLRPGKNGFALRNGIFHNLCERAQTYPDKDFFLIIDEINRGNLSKIFGELMMLIEADKRKKKYGMRLTYTDADDSLFFVPENLYIIGTMNTADRSLAIVDYALRRRFAFIEIKPEFGSGFQEFMTSKGLSRPLADHICKAVGKLNKEIVGDLNLGEGFQIGHSYFCGYNQDIEEQQWFAEVLEFEIRPLLEEIWFDDREKVKQMMALLAQ